MALTDNLLLTQQALAAQATALAEKVATLGTQIGDVQRSHTVAIALRDDMIDERDATIATLQARIAQLEAQPPPAPTPDPTPPPAPTPTGPFFGVDISDLGFDADLTEKSKVEGHRSLLKATSLGVVRTFAGSTPLGPGIWNLERLQALTAADAVHITTNLAVRNNRAGMKAALDSTPDKFRSFPGQVQWGVRHEMEADLLTQTAIDSWLVDNQVLAEELDAAEGYTSDDLIKTLLFYSQHVDFKGSWPKFHGGQNFGKMGMDCYHLQAQLNKTDSAGKPVGSYTTPAILFGYLKTIKEQTGRPICVPEWGGTLANTDPTGTGRAKAIQDGAAYMKELGVTHASWWCADGSKDPAGNVRKHHLEQVSGATSPEVTAFRALVR